MSVPLQIQPQKPLRGGLQGVVSPMPLTEEEWRTGVQLTPVCGLEPFVWGCASEDEKPVADIEDYSEFSSTMIGVEVQCGPNGPNSPIGDIARRIARQGLERTRWSRLAQVLSDGVVGGGSVGGWAVNPSLQSEALTPSGFDPDNPAGIAPTLQGLLDGLCACWQGDIVFHVPASYLPQFVRQYIVEWDSARGVWTMGPYDFSFDCYPNLGPEAVEDVTPTAQDGSEFWIYATSRPLAAFSREMAFDARGVDRNNYLVEALRGAIVAFDPCCAFAAKAATCVENCAPLEES